MTLAEALEVLRQYRADWTHRADQREALDFACAIMEALMS